MTMEDVKKGFMAQKQRITAKYAQDDLVCNNSFVQEMTAEHQRAKEQEEEQGAMEGTFIDLGEYGSLCVVVKQHDGKDDEDGEEARFVTVHNKELRYRVHDRDLIRIKLTHNINSHKDAISSTVPLKLIYIGRHGDEEEEENVFQWAPGFWEFDMPYPLQFDADEETNFWVFRGCSEEVFRIRVDRL